MLTSVAEYATFFDLAQKVAATFAFAVGGMWVLMNYMRDRTHVPRLQVEVEAEIANLAGGNCLLVTTKVSNLGRSIIKFPSPSENGAGPRGSSLMVAPLSSLSDTANFVPEFVEDIRIFEDEICAFEVLSHHTSIEPGLSIKEQKLIRFPNQDDQGFWIRLRIAAHKQSWSSTAIAIPKPKSASTNLTHMERPDA
ncbi:hypothetical protein [Methylocystis sp.]|uniref:hypothetical protein n=1 Tax=Methylocystis sp. TaxID=1911079 RepID=UPI003D128B30